MSILQILLNNSRLIRISLLMITLTCTITLTRTRTRILTLTLIMIRLLIIATIRFLLCSHGHATDNTHIYASTRRF